jgi:hypothetical protein
VVVVNQTAAPQAFELRLGEQHVRASLPAKTVGTYRWKLEPIAPPAR